jgi:hypothetical protein
MIESITKEIQTSKKQILLSSKYLDFTVVNSMMIAEERGVKIYGILDKSKDFSNIILFIKKFSDIIRSSDRIINMLRSPNTMIKKGDLPYSFAVIDGETTFFEIPLYGSDEFFTAFKVKDDIISDRLATMFWRIWEKSSPLAVEKILKTL